MTFFWLALFALVVSVPADGSKPVARLLATVELPSGVGSMEQIQVEISRRLASENEFSRWTPSCEVLADCLDCTLPIGKLDVCFEVEGLAPRCFWGVSAAPGSNRDLGPIKLTTGVSLHGMVDVADRSVDLAEVDIHLVPSVLGPEANPNASERRSLTEMATRSDSAGRFVLHGLTPGEYRIRASSDGFFGDEQTVQIASEVSEARLDGPLLLQPPAVLDVTVEPPLDPWGHPWVLQLQRARSLRSNVFETLEDRPSDVFGRWEVEGLAPGEYVVRVQDSKEATWEVRDYQLEPGDNIRFVPVDLVHVRGRLTLGSDPLVAEIIFGTTQGMIQIPMQSDVDGFFEGALPYEGLWGIDLRIDREWGSQGAEPVEVKRRSGKSYARVNIELPATSLQGRVAYQGEPVKALVLALREQTALGGLPGRRREIVLQTDAEGRFALQGLAPGSFQIQAYNETASSRWQTIRIQEDIETPELNLDLQGTRELEGHLIGPLGGVSGARIEARPSHGLPRTLVSEVDGSFRLRLDADATHVDFVVLPPAQGFFLQRVALQPKSKGHPVVLRMIPQSGTLVLRDLVPDAQIRFGNLGLSLGDLRKWLLIDGRISGHWSGSYSLAPAASGTWTVCVSGAALCEERVLLPGGEAVFEMPMRVSQESSKEERDDGVLDRR